MFLIFVGLTTFSCHKKSNEPTIIISINASDNKQVIENFGASDCWTIQNVGLWNDTLRNYASKVLFSKDFDSNGNPVGIGLSLWRFNIGAGSASQGVESNIPDKYRRVECFLDENGKYDFNKQAGQVWFLGKAKEYGVNQFVAFVNSPPVFMTKNQRANCSVKNESNLDETKYPAFADFMTEVILGLQNKAGIKFDFISPVVEPQWVWMGGQEGMHLDNNSFAQIVRNLDKSILSKFLQTKILIPEAGSFDYLYNNKQSGCGHQIDEFWGKGVNFVGDLPSVAPVVTAHGYFMNWPLKLMLNKRDSVNSHLQKYPKLRFWQTEYCIMGGNEGIATVPRDTTINLGLYVARLMHLDIVKGNVAAWHWWLAVSTYNYNDGLLVADDAKKTIKDTKLTWAFGNFSRFVRPGAIRLEATLSNNPTIITQTESLMVSSYKHINDKKMTIVAINMSKKEIPLKFKIDGVKISKFDAYETSGAKNLEKTETISSDDEYIIPPKSITTFYGDIE
jgi:O-glycosyl hydrolase